MKYVLLLVFMTGIMAQSRNIKSEEGDAPDAQNGIDDEQTGSGDGNIQNWFADDEGDSGVDQELSEAEKLKLGFERQTVQPDWIRRFKIVSDDVRRRIVSSEDFVETVSPLTLVAFDSENDDKEHKFVMSATKASDWMFVTFTDSATEEKHEFFFPYSALATNETIYLRKLLEECVKPVIIEPQPPTVAKCHYFYKKVTEAYEFSVKEMGPEQGADLMECYIESVKKMTRQPRVEILCVEGGIEDSQYKELTREQYEHIKANYNDLGNGQFEGDMEETEVTKVQAK